MDEPDPAPTASQQRLIDQLTEVQVSEIDSQLLYNCDQHWRKVARVVGTTMLSFQGKYTGIPDVYYAGRVGELVSAGRLQAQGDLRRMRFSEVRLPAK